MKQRKEFDLVILGGGPAGLTAAIYAARANLKTIVIEKNICGGLVNSSWTIENFPSQKRINGMALMEMFSNQARELGAEVEEAADIISVTLDGEIKTVDTVEGVFQAPAVILCTGRKPILLDAAGSCEQVHYCSVCDGADYKGKRILVVGGGNSAFDESLYLLSLGVAHITLIEQMDCFLAARSTCDHLLSLDKVTALPNTRLQDLVVTNRLQAVRLENTATGAADTIEVDGIFVFIGQKPNTEFFEGQVELDENGYINAGPLMETNFPGVYAAGDANRKRYRQITTAMNDGTIAALEAEHYLRNLGKRH